jgi:hypothetical protein
MSRSRVMVVAAALVVLGGASALALINPNFTPNDLVEQSEQVLVVKLSKPDAQNRVKMEVVRALKGKKPEAALSLELPKDNDWAKKIGEVAGARGADPVPLFIGKYKERGGEAGGEGAEALEGGLLQLDRDWVVMQRGKDNVWHMVQVDAGKQGTWDGGSDMLIKEVEYILKNPDDRVPVEVGCNWSGFKTLPAKMEGAARVALAVDLDGKGSVVLHVGAVGGDRLFGWDAAKKDFADLTGARKLAAKSRSAAWADFDGDGRLDLASWDGAALTIHSQGADGIFGKPADAGVKLEGAVLSLAALDVGGGKRAGMLVGTDKGPVVVKPAPDGWKAEALAVPAETLAALGKASACLVADLDGDGWADVFQPFEKGGLIFKGKGAGAFEAPVKNDMGTGKDLAVSAVGDYDMDGQLDIYMVGPECCQFWNNRGGLKFAEVFGLSGEMCYTAQPGGVAVQTTDINNDGLQDLFIALTEGYPHIYFNRGFRSFGKALSIVWMNQDFMAETKEGQQTAVMADFNGDGAQDMAVVLKSGAVTVFLRAVIGGDEAKPIQARVLLPAGAGTAGPATVTGWSSQRCLGAWSVTPGSSGALFGLGSPGEVKLKWKLPGGAEGGTTVELEKGAKIITLPAAGGKK